MRIPFYNFKSFSWIVGSGLLFSLLSGSGCTGGSGGISAMSSGGTHTGGVSAPLADGGGDKIKGWSVSATVEPQPAQPGDNNKMFLVKGNGVYQYPDTSSVPPGPVDTDYTLRIVDNFNQQYVDVLVTAQTGNQGYFEFTLTNLISKPEFPNCPYGLSYYLYYGDPKYQSPVYYKGTPCSQSECGPFSSTPGIGFLAPLNAPVCQ